MKYLRETFRIKQLMTFCLILISLVLQGCVKELITDINNLCNTEPDTSNLITVDINYWRSDTSRRLKTSRFNLQVCEDHFSATSDAGREVREAARRLNRIVGSNLNINIIAVPHLEKENLFQDPPIGNFFDYVDNVGDRITAIPCHLDNEFVCYDATDGVNDRDVDGFVMNTCKYTGKWNGTGKADNFVISVNGNCYSDFDGTQVGVPSNDHPHAHGVMHELGHVMGMQHISSRGRDHRGYISTMHGNLDYPSAYDAAYIRKYYGSDEVTEEVDFVAGSIYLIQNTDGDFEKRKVYSNNPQSLSISPDNSRVIDTDTGSIPIFNVSWFNIGNVGGDESKCLINAIAIESTDGAERLTIKKWKVATMPAESQDQWSGEVEIDLEKYNELSKLNSYNLVFYVDFANAQGETSDSNNMVYYPISIN